MSAPVDATFVGAPPRPTASDPSGEITVALAGQPNVGKSTVFNLLTGLSQHVGNWPGKTVACKTGRLTHQGQAVQLVDLPGTYGLTASSEEERVARDFILHERPEVVVVIVNAAALERNLYLVAELLSLPAPLVVGLNMLDVAEQQGVHVEPQVLAAALGVPVVPLVASRNQGVRELVEAAQFVAGAGAPPECARRCPFPQGRSAVCAVFAPNRPAVRPEHQAVLDAIGALIRGRVPPPYPEDWVALKLLEGDAELTDKVRAAVPEAWGQIHALLRQHENAYLDIVGGRYEWIGRMVRAAVARPKAGVITLTDRLDRLATHPVVGLVVLLGILALAFWLTYTAALPIVAWLDRALVGSLTEWLRERLVAAPAWLSGLLVDGVMGGAGTVLTFLPILVVFFAVLGVLEDTGYLTRAAYVTDGYLHWMGLHGRSFIPLFLGFGCNVPAVIATRIVDDRRARLVTLLLVPFVPCAARLAVVTFLAPALFGRAAMVVTWGLVVANLIMLAVTGLVMNRLVFRGTRSALIMELPLYHRPNARTIGLFVWQNVREFIGKAGTVILAMSALVWALSRLPGGSLERSWLAGVGRWLEPAGRLLGLHDWRLIVALLTGFIAKENTVATLGVLYGAGAAGAGLAERVAGVLTPGGALAFLVVQMLFIPCAATLVTMRQESGGWKWPAFSAGLLLLISLGTGIAVYQAAALLGLH